MASRSRVIRGIGASPGIALGRVFLLDRRQIRVRRYHIEPDQVEYEIARLRKAIDESVAQLEGIRGRFVGGGMDHQTILEAHEMMLADQSLFDEAVESITGELVNSEWAVNKVVSRIRGLFDKVTDSYFKERRGDIDFVGDRILRNLVGQTADITDLSHLEAGTIVVAHDLSPADTALLSRQRVTAFVTEVGGKTSHTSIVARSLEVPAVVGAHGVFNTVGSGDMAMVDGTNGLVVVRPTRTQQDKARRKAAQLQRQNLDLLEARALPARTLDGVDIEVTGNIEIPGEASIVLDRGGAGIGLYRTEFLFVGRTEPPNEEDHYRAYCHIFDEMGDRPVTIRTLDLGGDKLFGGMRAEQEPNPALGLRAIRYCFEHPELFEAQIGGLLRAASRGNLRVMLPLISGIAELRKAREIIERVRIRLEAAGKDIKPVPLGVMIEVPSAVLTADLLAKEADFFAIGTNDLMQYLLAIDRTNDRVAYLYEPLHPAMLRTIKGVVEAAQKANIPVSLCGEMAGDPTHIPILVGFGLEHLSTNAGSIPRIKRLIREISREDCRVLTKEALECTTALEVRELVSDFVQAKGPLSAQASDPDGEEP